MLLSGAITLSTSRPTNCGWQKQYCGGFTLIEAMVVVSILAILAAIATPNMSRFLQSRRTESAARNISNDALFARGEAIKRNAPVLVCAGVSGDCAATPSSADWMNGWRVCYDKDANGACDAGSDADPNPIRVRDAVNVNVTLAGPESRLQFNADGTMGASVAASFSAVTTQDSKYKWVVRLAPSGATTAVKEGV
jgi:type IV fimbrial biogenesis protein FimT